MGSNPLAFTRKVLVGAFNGPYIDRREGGATDDDIEQMSMVGTVLFCAPEILRCEPYNEKVDIFSFANVLLESLVGGGNFIRSCFKQGTVAATVLTGGRPRIPEGVETRYPELATLIRRCWLNDFRARPSALEVFTRLQEAPCIEDPPPLSPGAAPGPQQPAAHAASPVEMHHAFALGLRTFNYKTRPQSPIQVPDQRLYKRPYIGRSPTQQTRGHPPKSVAAAPAKLGQGGVAQKHAFVNRSWRQRVVDTASSSFRLSRGSSAAEGGGSPRTGSALSPRRAKRGASSSVVPENAAASTAGGGGDARGPQPPQPAAAAARPAPGRRVRRYSHLDRARDGRRLSTVMTLGFQKYSAAHRAGGGPPSPLSPGRKGGVAAQAQKQEQHAQQPAAAIEVSVAAAESTSTRRFSMTSLHQPTPQLFALTALNQRQADEIESLKSEVRELKAKLEEHKGDPLYATRISLSESTTIEFSGFDEDAARRAEAGPKKPPPS